MRNSISAALALCLAACAAAERPAEMRAPAGATAAPAPQQASQAGGEFEQLIQKLKDSYNISDQARKAQADAHYRLAERYFQASDFEKAEIECERAIKLENGHAPARALHLEIQFILGRGKAYPQMEEYRRLIDEALVRHSQTLVEIDNAMERGRRAYNRGEYDQAESEFRKILEYAKWMPTGIELETRRKTALDFLERTKESRRQKDLDLEKTRLKLIEEEKARDELRRLIDQKRELEILFGQAQIHFEREQYTDCADMCDRILFINPNLTSVSEMKNVAQRLNHMTRGRNNLKNYIEEWKRTFEQVEINSIVQADILQFADHDTWLNLIMKREPKGLQDLQEDIQPEDLDILNKLKSIRITIDMNNAPLTNVIDYIREISALNIHIDTKAIENPDQEMITFKVADIVLDGALRLMLGPKGKAYKVEGGVVVITSQDALKKQVKLELYDVQDLTYGMQDFPGVDISLATDSIGTTISQGEESKQQFTGEDLATLIKNTIHRDQWEEADGKSIQFQNGLLIVRNAIEIHKSIRKFLSDLRASTSMMVTVETRFLSVEDTFLQQVGMDFRDVDGARVQGITNLADINPAFPINAQFISPGPGFSPQSAGITGVFGDSIARSMGARVQQIMTGDFLVNRFFTQALNAIGGGTLQYTLLDDISLETIVRLVSRSDRNHVLTAPKLTLFNTQRGNFRISNQMAYVRDYDVQIATAAVALDPIVDVVSDGISLDVRPVVSADRRFVTLELRPTIATLFPPPPGIFTITTNVTVPGAPITDALPVTIETPIINIQRIRTTVVVPDRGTLMLGGLTVVFDEDAESSIPIWRSVPILGNIGSLKVKGLQRKQSLVIVSVRIIIPDEEERRRF